jgi:peptide/nickel transport system substrate-binding protein
MRLYFTRDKRWNFSAFDNAELTALTEKAQFESDPVTYEAMCRRMVAIVGAEVPELFLWQPNHVAVMAITIEVYTYQYYLQIDFRDLSRV